MLLRLRGILVKLANDPSGLTNPLILSSSVQHCSRLRRIALALLALPFCALQLPAQSTSAIPASARELFTLATARPDFSSLSPLTLPSSPRIADTDRAAFSPATSGIMQNSQPSWRTERFHWRSGMLQGLFFLGIQQGMRMKEEKTRRSLRPPNL